MCVSRVVFLGENLIPTIQCWSFFRETALNDYDDFIYHLRRDFPLISTRLHCPSHSFLHRETRRKIWFLISSTLVRDFRNSCFLRVGAPWNSPHLSETLTLKLAWDLTERGKCGGKMGWCSTHPHPFRIFPNNLRNNVLLTTFFLKRERTKKDLPSSMVELLSSFKAFALTYVSFRRTWRGATAAGIFIKTFFFMGRIIRRAQIWISRPTRPDEFIHISISYLAEMWLRVYTSCFWKILWLD